MKPFARIPTSPELALPPAELPTMARRVFLRQSLVLAGSCAAGLRAARSGESVEGLKPIGTARGIHPGRVVWAHDPEVLNWGGPDDGHWWEGDRLKQARVEAMMARTLCELTGTASVTEAWSGLFRHLNQARGKGSVGYTPGEKVLIKPNWVGLIYREGHVHLEHYTFIRRHNYMNTAPQMILALLRQLTGAGVRSADITVSDTLACLVHEYFNVLHGPFPDVHYEDCAGKFGRTQAQASAAPLYWSSRPEGKAQDHVPRSFAEADYLINFANFKAHQGSGVTLCAKNHYGSLVRWPVQQGYYDMHPACFSKQTRIYRPLVDLLGHAQLGGKTVLYLVDGLFAGLHPRDALPQRMKTPPFNNHWPCSLFASQDPVAVDSVALDFLQAEWTDYPRQAGVDDYLHEAALAADPPSGTFYDPDHAVATQRLPSLGVHEHWNNPQDKQYSRNLGAGPGIELVPLKLGAGGAA
ncbi:MAG: DUF362 domain-containing protein [Verrucomicrobia bacterium]|nr:DUF362 domain-containing protein [Verrucomicrobiota bacterium]